MPTPAPPDPAAEYRRRRDARQLSCDRLNRIDAGFATARLAVFAVFALTTFAAAQDVVSWWMLLVPVAAFAVLVQQHDRVIRARDAAARAVTFYERGLGRIEDRWAGTGEPGERFRDDRHPYAADLDLFGPGSLFELLSLARTRAGEDVLAGWLTAPAAPADIAGRHAAVTELTGRLDLREALSMAGAEVRAGVHGDALVAWAEAEPVLTPPALRWGLAALTALAVATIAAWLRTGESTPMLVVLLVQSLIAWALRHRVEHALHAANGPARDLDILSQILARLEREPFTAPRLVQLQADLGGHHVAGSKAIASLHRLVELHDWQHNVIFLVISLPLLWGTHVAWAIEAWRRAHGRRIRRWLTAVGEVEALASLSAYRFEHPGDPYPDIVAMPADAPAPLFDGAGLGHPLLPAARMIRNDVLLSPARQLLVISGSNMSGKSTMLRTVGINAVLALAGAPVRAASLRISPLVIGATLRIQDSLQEGRSRFYAEISRLREIKDLAAGPAPLLFLLDEVLSGTNSHDRLVGATGILQRLIAGGAIGLITTHDLALTAVADDLAPRAANVHFEDWFDAGEMRFDYRMKEGPVTRSNAIALMRAVGLEVDELPKAVLERGRA